jgi:hypothetical protein
MKICPLMYIFEHKFEMLEGERVGQSKDNKSKKNVVGDAARTERAEE